MTALLVRPAARGGRGALVAPGALAALAVAVGALAPAHPARALAVVIGCCLLLVVAVRVEALPLFLAATMFVESLALSGGLTVDRLAGGLAIVALSYLLIVDRSLLQGFGSALLAIVGAYGFWLLASAYWASTPSAVYRELFSYGLTVAYALGVALLVRSRVTLRRVFIVLVVLAAGFGLAAIATYVVAHDATRAAGLQGDPNYFAEYQILALPAALALAALEPRRGRRRLYYLVVAIILFSVVATQSRGGLLALLVVLLALALLPWRTFFRSRGHKYGSLVALVACASAAVLFGAGSFAHRAGTLLHPFSASSGGGSGRLDLWLAAWQSWKRHPWLGLGAFNFRAHSLDILQATPGVNTLGHYVTAGREVHNAYLETLVELGPLGLALFLTLFVLAGMYFLRVARQARRTGDDELRRLALALLLSLVSVAITSFFLSNELGHAAWILIGLALALERERRRAAAQYGFG